MDRDITIAEDALARVAQTIRDRDPQRGDRIAADAAALLASARTITRPAGNGAR